MTESYMLDTNTASYVIRGTYPAIREKLQSVPMSRICISTITEAELLFGVARRPDARQLRRAVGEFLLLVEIRPWDSAAAKSYAESRDGLERNGAPLGAMDLLIAAHALACGKVLVSNDRAFGRIGHLELADWSKS